MNSNLVSEMFQPGQQSRMGWSEGGVGVHWASLYVKSSHLEHAGPQRLRRELGGAVLRDGDSMWALIVPSVPVPDCNWAQYKGDWGG